MRHAELKMLGWTDEKLAREAGKLFGKEIVLDEGSDDPLTCVRRGLWFGQYSAHALGGKTYEVRGVVGVTVREPAPEPKPYPPEGDIPKAVAWMDAAMDDGTYVSERDLIALHELHGDHYQDFERAFQDMVQRRLAAGKHIPS